MIAGSLPVEAGSGLELLLRATLLIGAAWAAAAALRQAGASASARYLAWLLGIAALLALPLLWWLVPALHLPILPAEPVPGPADFPGPMTGGSAAASSPGDRGWSESLLLAYGIGAGLLMLRFAAGRYRLSRLWRDSRPGDSGWDDLLLRVSREIGLSRSVELRIASGSVMPLTWGTLAPKVLLPAEANGWPAERRRLVLLHELAHVDRRDSLARSAASLACALYWFHPFVWFAARQMRLEQEHAADDQVLESGAPARTYALSLLQLARRIEDGVRPDHGAAMAEICQLERRVISITTPVRRGRPGLAFRCSSMAMASLVTLAAAAGVLARPSLELPDSLRMEHSPLAPPPAKQAQALPQETNLAREAPAPTLASSVAEAEEAPPEGGDTRGVSELLPTPAGPATAPASASRQDEVQARPIAIALSPEELGSRSQAAQSQPVYGPHLPRSEPVQEWNERLQELTPPRDSSGPGRGRRIAERLVSLVLFVAASNADQQGTLPR